MFFLALQKGCLSQNLARGARTGAGKRLWHCACPLAVNTNNELFYPEGKSQKKTFQEYFEQ